MFTVCILCDSDREALTRTQKSLPQASQVLYFACAEALPGPMTEPVIEVPWSDRLDHLYQAVREKTAGPFVLLEAGETLSPESWQALTAAAAKAPAPILACVVKRETQLELVPRLFLGEGPLPSGAFLCLADPEMPLITDCEIQAQAAALFYRQAGYHRLWLTRLNETTEVSEDAHFMKGLMAFQAHRDQEALEHFQTLTQKASIPTWRRFAQVMLLKTLWETGQQSEALTALERFRQQDRSLEQNPSLWVLRGVMARQLKQVELALDCFHQARELVQREDFYALNPLVLLPDITWKPVLGMAEIELAENLFSQAYLHFQQALQDLPGHDYVLSGLLKAAFFTRHYQTLQEILGPPKERSELRGISEDAQQLLRYFLCLQTNEADETLYAAIDALFGKGLNVRQDAFLVSVMVEVAILLLHHRQHALARRFFEVLVSLVPDQPLLAHNLAYSYFAQGDYARAEEHYRALLQHAPHFVESHFDLAKTLVMQDRLPEAIETLKNLLQRHPQFTQARQALRELEAREREAVMMPLPQAPAAADPTEMPFIFVFPLEASWENGLDIALKAFYQEFLPEENVIFALPTTTEPKLLTEAKAWAQQHYQEDLLPPVALLVEPLPLLAGRSAWVLPWRVHPGTQILTALQTGAYPALLTEMPLQHPQGQYLPAGIHAEATGSSRRLWKETDLDALRAQLRLAYNGEISPPQHPASDSELNTHSLLTWTQTTPAVAQLSEATLQAPAAVPATRLSVCLIIRDEALTLARCLDSVHDAVDEIIVVDTGSVDQSREIAATYDKVKLFELPWADDFAAARNFALEHASGDWILSLDGDEYVGPEFIATLRYLLTLPQQPDSYTFPVLAIDEQGQHDPEHSLGSVPRLFPNHPAYRYRGRIHEMIYHANKESLRYFLLRQLPIYHTGYQAQVRVNKDKRSRDMTLMQRLIAEAPDAPETARIYAILGSIYEKSEQLEQALETYTVGLQSVQDPLVHALLETQRFSIWLKLKRGHELLAHRAIAQEHVQRRLLLAQALQQTGQADAALAEAKQALTLAESQALMPDPLNLKVSREHLLNFLALVSEQLGQTEDALYFMRRCLKISSDPLYLQRYHRLQQVFEKVSL